ncbi:MAG: transcriptional regulator [Clostridiales bacterium GWF2_36_10]|nr:MAG: transcriptional regulator [Clostridiales bacterium GWF2_36_10]HAN21441.1 transcriptional regulator [Clostridiales bacterium]
MKLKVQAVLDPLFTPLSVVCREMREKTKDNGQDLVIGCQRNKGYTTIYKTRIFADGTGHDDENFRFVERMVKALLWVVGGYKIIIAGSTIVGEKIKAAYQDKALRNFDFHFMSRVYEKPFEVELRSIENAPVTYEAASPVGRHLDGCRIGFDAGGSDRKVSAVIDGEAVYSEEVIWHPKLNSDPSYQYQGILESMKTAASHMPRVDGIGVSSAGVYVDNRIMIASLFLKVSDEDFDKYVKNMYIDVAKEIGENIPIEVANDGDVTALAGAMELNDVNVLGVAMGTSEAGGYVDEQGNITGWLNELAFVPVDYSKDAMVDEWSGDYGCGVKYFSQDGVIKLCPAAGIELDESASPAEKLKVVQRLMAEGDERAVKIYDTIGVYFGYAIAFYAEFYKIKHVLIMGRVTSGEGGVILLKKAQEVLDTEFPELASQVKLHIPDESSRRVGQSVAAASLPKLN